MTLGAKPPGLTATALAVWFPKTNCDARELVGVKIRNKNHGWGDIIRVRSSNKGIYLSIHFGTSENSRTIEFNLTDLKNREWVNAIVPTSLAKTIESSRGILSDPDQISFSLLREKYRVNTHENSSIEPSKDGKAWRFYKLLKQFDESDWVPDGTDWSDLESAGSSFLKGCLRERRFSVKGNIKDAAAACRMFRACGESKRAITSTNEAIRDIAKSNGGDSKDFSALLTTRAAAWMDLEKWSKAEAALKEASQLDHSDSEYRRKTWARLNGRHS